MDMIIDERGMADQHDQAGRVSVSDRDELARLREQLAKYEAEIANLKIALQTARTIGMALGIIVAGEKVTPNEAFAHLSKLSNKLNTKVHNVADAIVLTGQY